MARVPRNLPRPLPSPQPVARLHTWRASLKPLHASLRLSRPRQKQAVRKAKTPVRQPPSLENRAKTAKRKPRSLAREPETLANRPQTPATKPQTLARSFLTLGGKPSFFVIRNSTFVPAMFDPTLPQEGTPLDAVQMRSQLNGLKALIDAILTVTAAQVDGVNTLPPNSPANASVTVSGNTLHFTFEIPQGLEGPMGQPGPPFAQAVVDSVNTVDPGTPAAVGVSFDGTNVRFTFDIPRGNDGAAGSNGSDGAQGPPFAQAVVDAVNTLPAGSNAAVNVSFDGTNVRFTFDIPQGSNGSDGAQGPPGEVSQVDLNNGLQNNLSQCSNNSNGVSTLNQGADSNYNQTQMQDVLNKLDELITALRR